MTNNLETIRKRQGLTHQDIADLLGIARTTYAYREKMGNFEDDEKKKIAKFLKVDMTTISWTKPFFQGVNNDQQKELDRLRMENSKLQEQVKFLQEMIDKLLEKR